MTMPTTDDVNKAREQATQVLGEAMEQARMPLLAALGAGDMATRALLDTISKVREQADSARAEFAGDPVELRKRLDAYVQSATRLYGYLAERGEETLERIRTAQPEDGVPQQRSDQDETEGDTDVSDDVLGKSTKREGARATKSSASKGGKTKKKGSESE